MSKERANPQIMAEAIKEELPDLARLIERCFKSVGPNVDSARTPDGRPVYGFNQGAVNGSVTALLSVVETYIRTHFKPRFADYEIQWRQRPVLRSEKDEQGNRRRAVSRRFATNPELPTNQ